MTRKKLAAVGRVLWENRKSEIAVTLSVASIIRQIVQAVTGH